MGRALIAALGGSLSLTTVGAFVGVAMLTAPAAQVTAHSSESGPAPKASVVEVQAVDARFMPTVLPALRTAFTELQNYAAKPEAPAQPAVFDTDAMRAGFTSRSTFTAHITGLGDLSSLGATITGTVIDATHFTLEFPASQTITRYERTGDHAHILIRGQELDLHLSGSAGFGTVSPEDFLPARLWALVAERWASALKPAEGPGDYAAAPEEITKLARKASYPARDWSMTAHLDGAGRLETLHFAGVVTGSAADGSEIVRPLALDISITYP